MGALCALFTYQFVVRLLPEAYVQIFDQKRALARTLGDVVPKGSPILWDGKIPYLPNADVYRNYRLVRASENVEAYSSTLHAFAPSEREAPQYLLRAEPLPTGATNFELVRAWQFPSYVAKRIDPPSIKEFFLYRRSATAR